MHSFLDIGAIYLDGGLNSVDKMLSTLLFSDEQVQYLFK